MKGKDLLEKIELADIKYVEEAAGQNKKRTKIRNIFLIAAILAVLCVLAVVVGMKLDTGKKNGTANELEDKRNIENTPTETSKDVFPEGGKYEIKEIPHWEEMTDDQRYGNLFFENRQYVTRTVAVQTENVGDHLGKATVSGYDHYTDSEHKITGDVFSVKGISEKAAVCFKFEENDGYAYAYVNSYYTPETLGQFIDDLSLETNLKTGKIYDYRENIKIDGSIVCDSVIYDGVPTSIIWEMLFDDRSLKNESYSPEVDSGTSVMSISVSLDILGYHDHTLTLTSDGRMWTNILDTGKYFKIGKDKAEAFMKKVTENYQGYVEVPETTAEVEESKKAE